MVVGLINNAFAYAKMALNIPSHVHLVSLSIHRQGRSTERQACRCWGLTVGAQVEAEIVIFMASAHWGGPRFVIEKRMAVQPGAIHRLQSVMRHRGHRRLYRQVVCGLTWLMLVLGLERRSGSARKVRLIQA